MQHTKQPPPAPKPALTGLMPVLAYLKPYGLQVTGAILALVVTAMITLSMGWGLGYLVDNGFASDSSAQTLIKGVMLFCVLAVLLIAGTFIRFCLVSWIGERISADLRDQTFRHVVRLDPGFFETHLASDIQSRITTDTSILQNVIGSSVSIAARSFIMFVGAVVMLAYTNASLAVLIFVSMPFILVPVLLFGRMVQRLSKRSQEKLATVGSYVNEVLRNIKTVQANLHEQQDVAKFSEHVQTAFRVAMQRIRARAMLIALVMLLVLMAVAGMLWSGGQDVLTGQITAGELISFIFFAFMMTLSVAAISEVYSELQRAAGATSRLFELLAVKPQLTVPAAPASVPSGYSYVLSFDCVSHAYPTRPNTLVLEGLSFSIKVGEYVALVGPSGAGKSTLFELVLRFYDPTSGVISFGNTDIRRLTFFDLRSRIAIVPQTPVLFRGSIRDNIAYARPCASESDIEEAAETGHVLEFARLLPDGLETEVGEGGVLLSGGQRQRIAIARAVLKKPELLLLDEATSSLDAENEFIVRSALANLMATTTTLVIAHRLTTVQDAERILLLARGKLLANNNHRYLMQHHARYRRLVELQFKRPAPAGTLRAG